MGLGRKMFLVVCTSSFAFFQVILPSRNSVLAKPAGLSSWKNVEELLTVMQIQFCVYYILWRQCG